MNNFDPKQNNANSRKTIGYVTRKEATQADYDRIGFMSGLEVHQQILTDKKLFCHCPAGVFNDHEDYDAEVIRHMRPTLSELGEYDGTALMEFKTRKEIVYRLKNETTCTYEVDDTPPFPIDRQALERALEISLLSKLNIVGEVHITRKQYLDGSIPTGFQRTAILGVEGEIQLRSKKVRLIQLSIEEDSCREISDIGHTRVYKTDRLGMPLIETVTYPDMVNPDEVKEACDYIRFLNRSTGKVRTGMGAGRQDVNVSCKGGTRIEIKGVAHTKWIPELTHIESYRQWALLHVRTLLNERVDEKKWKPEVTKLNFFDYNFDNEHLKEVRGQGYKFYAVNLPHFKGILSHFTQPTKVFADEITDRLKVIACLERPNMAHSEELEPMFSQDNFKKLAEKIGAKSNDAQIIFWGPKDDIETALETIEERCRMAFEGIPNETRKSFEDGSTIFERVLPGADRMYPDTDSAPIPLENSYIDKLSQNLPMDIIDRYHQMTKWNIPENYFDFILQKNLYPLIEKIVSNLKIDARFVGCFIGNTLKGIEGRILRSPDFEYDMIYGMFKYLLDNKIDLDIAYKLIPPLYEHPKMDFESILQIIKFKKIPKEEILSKVAFLNNKFKELAKQDTEENRKHWVMGELRKTAIGNIKLAELSTLV